MRKSQVNPEYDFNAKKWVVSLVNTLSLPSVPKGEGLREVVTTAVKDFDSKYVSGHAVLVVEGLREDGSLFLGKYGVQAKWPPEAQSTLQLWLGNKQGYIGEIECTPSADLRLAQDTGNYHLSLIAESRNSQCPATLYVGLKSDAIKCIYYPTGGSFIEEFITRSELRDHDAFPNQNDDIEQFSAIKDQILAVLLGRGVLPRTSVLIRPYAEMTSRSWFVSPEKAIKIITSIEESSKTLEDAQAEAKRKGCPVEWPFKYQTAGSYRLSILGGNGGDSCITWLEKKLAIGGINVGSATRPIDSSKASPGSHITCNIS
jgi:hypothetical protein